MSGRLQECDGWYSNLTCAVFSYAGNDNEISVLANEAFDAIWKDSLLRHSNIMEGLFHNSVVVCESDTDCRFYSMIDSYLKKAEGCYPETLFVHCGGKQRLKVAVKALQSLKQLSAI